MTDLNREVIEITSEEMWLELRKKDITASSVAALFEGANPYEDVNILVQRLAGYTKQRTPAMRAGRLLEAVFPQAIAEERPDWRLEKATTYHRIPDLRLGGTPDYWRYLIKPPRDLFECKAPSEHQWNNVWRGVPPLYINLQVQTQMLVTGAEHAVIAVIVRSSELPLYLFEVDAHPAAQAKILDAVAAFWTRHDAGEFPAPTPSDEVAALLDDGSHVDLNGDNRLPEWLERREELMETRGAAERTIKNIDYEIKNRMGKASTGWLEGWQISFKCEHRKGYTVAPSDPRVLRIKRTKEMDDADIG